MLYIFKPNSTRGDYRINASTQDAPKPDIPAPVPPDDPDIPPYSI